MLRSPAYLIPVVAAFALSPLSAMAQAVIEPKECLAIPRVGQSSRNPIHTDTIEAKIVSGEWKPPHAGDTVKRPGGGTATWAKAEAGKDGSFSGPAFTGGYASFTIHSDTNRAALLEAVGHSLVYVNGVPRTGDPYGYGWTRLPIPLVKGDNDLLFLCGRGSLRVKVSPVEAAFIQTADPTLPDFRIGEKLTSQGAVIVGNATNKFSEGLTLSVAGVGLTSKIVRLPSIPPYGTRKIIFPVIGPAPLEPGHTNAELTLKGPALGKTAATASFEIRIIKKTDPYKVTFVSAIDGSLQYYAVNPRRIVTEDSGKKAAPTRSALFLSLHGASVEALGQAQAYYAKSWGDIVCPTNRRPYGFDWEDWGQMDAMEVLSLAKKALNPAPGRVFLTGHSMGGHGTWHIGVTYPEQFAAIGPSAGWISFASYAGSVKPENPTPTQQLLLRCSNPSDTVALDRNYAQLGVYIIHGDADDNVPVEQAREMKQRLAEFHHDYDYHEQPGAGHWWGNSDEPGAACVDWPKLFDFFSRHYVPDSAAVRQVDFVTANPGISASDHWVTIQQQTAPLALSSVSIRLDPGQRRFVGKTSNVARMTLDVSMLPAAGELTLDLDGKKQEALPYPSSGKLSLHYNGSSWSVSEPLAASAKTPLRYGPFKQAFQHRMEFVYSTGGTPEENAWSLAKARYDAETFWYRGNGAVDVVSDAELLKQKDKQRGVILYGNSDSNRAWPELFKDSPVQVSRGKVTVGSKVITGGDLACLFLRPRPGSDTACVAAVAGSGLVGLRLTERVPYFVSGVDLPDYFVVGPDTLLNGVSGVRAAGIFGNNWEITSEP